MGKIKTLFLSICLLFVGLTVGHASPLKQDTGAPVIQKATIECVAEIYTAKIGVKELTGNNDGAFVNECLAITGLDNQAWIKKTGKGYEWCAAFVSWTYDKSEVKALRSAWAPSWFPTSKTIFIKGKPTNLTPQRADVFGIWYSKDQRIGHVGFIDQWPRDGDYCITVEGNWGGQVSKNRRIKNNIYKVSRWIDSNLTNQPT